MVKYVLRQLCDQLHESPLLGEALAISRVDAAVQHPSLAIYNNHRRYNTNIAQLSDTKMCELQ